MPNINFTCPHCSHTTELASRAEGMKGNCPSCKAEVVITSDNPESEWLVMSSGLKSETPTKLKDSEIISLIRNETIAGGAQLSNLSKPSGGWISLKDSHFYQYVEEVKTEKKRRRENEKENKLAQITLEKKEGAEANRKAKEEAMKAEEAAAKKAAEKAAEKAAAIWEASRKPAETGTKTTTKKKGVGLSFFVAAAMGVCLVLAIRMDTTVRAGSFGRVHNIGLMSEKDNYITLSALGLVGAILWMVIEHQFERRRE